MSSVNLRCIKCEIDAEIIEFSFKRKQTRPTFNKDCSCSLFLTAADSGERERERLTLELLVVRAVVWCGGGGGGGVVCSGLRRHLSPGTLPWLGLVRVRQASRLQYNYFPSPPHNTPDNAIRKQNNIYFNQGM